MEKKWISWDKHWEKRRKEAEDKFVEDLMKIDEPTRIRLEQAKQEQIALTQKHKEQGIKAATSRYARKREVTIQQQSRKTMQYQKKKADGGFSKA